MAEGEFFVSDGLSEGRAWGTYRRRPSGNLRRVKSPKLPLRATREEAERDLADWLRQKQVERELADLRLRCREERRKRA